MRAADERRRELQRRLGISKAHGLVLSCVFFFLTTLMVVAAFFMFGRSFITGILCIAAAEFIIRGPKFDWPGVTGALWLGGLFALIASVPGGGEPEALLLFAIAAGLAGWRVRNALFGALAAVLVIMYFGVKHWNAVAAMTGIGIGVFALVARAREWRRPSTEELFTALLLVAPLAGAIAAEWRSSMFFGSYVDAAWASSLVRGFAFAALAVAEFVFGERKRDRVALIAGAESVVIAFVLMRDLFASIPIEWKLIAAGAAIFAVATAISRALKSNTRGFVMTPVKRAYEEALRVFGTAAFAPHQAKPEAAPQPVGSGGSFGGAGATGDF